MTKYIKMWDAGLPVVLNKYEQEEASGLVIKVKWEGGEGKGGSIMV